MKARISLIQTKESDGVPCWLEMEIPDEFFASRELLRERILNVALDAFVNLYQHAQREPDIRGNIYLVDP